MMFKSIIICFIAVTLSVAKPVKDAPVNNSSAIPDPITNNGTPSSTVANITITPKDAPAISTTTTAKTADPAQPDVKASTTTSKPASTPSQVHTEPAKVDTTPTLKPSTTEAAKPEQKVTKHEEAAPAPSSTPETTTKSISTKATTETPVKVVTQRGFHGGSFVGGIVLTLGLIACGFVGFKYYKNHTERNYRTL